MKANNRSQYIIGITVILCSAALLAALTFALSGFSVRAGGRKLAIDFHDATGIKLHSAARYAGKAAGTVAEIRYLSPEERLKAADSRNAVRVTLQLSEEVPPLLDNITAKLDASYSDKYYFDVFEASLPGQGEMEQDAYTIANLRLGWESSDGDYRADAFVENLTDKLYSETRQAVGTTGAIIGEFSQPRRYGIRVAATLGE